MIITCFLKNKLIIYFVAPGYSFVKSAEASNQWEWISSMSHTLCGLATWYWVLCVLGGASDLPKMASGLGTPLQKSLQWVSISFSTNSPFLTVPYQGLLGYSLFWPFKLSFSLPSQCLGRIWNGTWTLPSGAHSVPSVFALPSAQWALSCIFQRLTASHFSVLWS